MKSVRIVIVTLLALLLTVACSSESTQLKNEVLEEYELKQIELSFPALDVINMKPLDIYNDVLYYRHGSDTHGTRDQNVVYSVDLEGTIKEVLKVDENEVITSFLVHNDDFYYTSFEDFTKKQSDVLFPISYNVTKVKNNESKLLIQGAVTFIDEIPSLSLVNDNVYSIISGITAVDYAEIHKPGIFLYESVNEEFVYTLDDTQTIDYMNEDLRFRFNNAGIGNQNNKVIFSVIDSLTESDALVSKVFIYVDNEMITQKLDGVYFDNFMTLNDKIIYGVGEDFGGPYNLKYNVSKNNDIKEASVHEDEFYDVKKVIDFKDGIIVSESSHHNTDGAKTYYIELDQNDMISKTEISLFKNRLDALSTLSLPHGFVSLSEIRDGTIVIEYISKK